MNFNFTSEVSQKAQVALSAEAAGDPRFALLLEKLSERLKISKEEAKNNIVLLALGMNI